VQQKERALIGGENQAAKKRKVSLGGVRGTGDIEENFRGEDEKGFGERLFLRKVFTAMAKERAKGESGQGRLTVRDRNAGRRSLFFGGGMARTMVLEEFRGRGGSAQIRSKRTRKSKGGTEKVYAFPEPPCAGGKKNEVGKSSHSRGVQKREKRKSPVVRGLSDGMLPEIGRPERSQPLEDQGESREGRN